MCLIVTGTGPGWEAEEPELVGGQGAEFDGAALSDQVDADLLGGLVAGVVDQFLGAPPFADAVGQVEGGQGGGGQRHHQGS